MAPFSSLRLLRPPFDRASVDVWPRAKRSNTSLSPSANTRSNASTPSTPRSQLSEPKRMRRVVSLTEHGATTACMALTVATTVAATSQPPCASASAGAGANADVLSKARRMERHLRATIRADAKREMLHGFVKVPWVLGLRHGRMLALKGRELWCVDHAADKLFWRVTVEGARVRVQLPQCKIVLSKLHAAPLIQFWAPDQLAARRWAAALLRASATVPLERARAS